MIRALFLQACEGIDGDVVWIKTCLLHVNRKRGSSAKVLELSVKKSMQSDQHIPLSTTIIYPPSIYSNMRKKDRSTLSSSFSFFFSRDDR